MRRLVAWLLDGLPFDPRSRRALDETLLDWAHEESAASSGMAAGLVQISGVASIVRAIAWSAGREVPRVPFALLMTRTALYAIVPAIIAAVAVEWSLLASGFSTAAHPVAMFATSLPTMVLTFVPPALLLAMTWRQEPARIPPAGAAFAAACIVPVLFAVVMPVAIWLTIAVYLGAIGDRFGMAMPGASETPDMGQLVGLAGGPVTVSVWLAGNGAMSGACVWFGAALSSRTRLRSVFWLVAVPAAYVAFIMLVPYLTWWVSPWQGKTAIDVWLAAGLVLIVAVVVGSRSDRLHVQP